MGKAKRLKSRQKTRSPYENPREHVHHTRAKGATRNSGKASHQIGKSPPNPKSTAVAQQQPLPFKSTDKILLVGEGDFSFSVALVTHHHCTRLTATTLESNADLISKYPQAIENVDILQSSAQTVLFTIDATKLGLPHIPGAGLLRKQAFDVVVFNFPHVGGKSTDVNRQVRANQGLVVSFLEGAKRVLAPSGAVLVTLFEGQPYELWGIRNLARHVGLQVERSMRFEPSLYPGYRHARTLGNLEGGWKGEDRPARMYILRKVEQSNTKPSAKQPKRESTLDSEDEFD